MDFLFGRLSRVTTMSVHSGFAPEAPAAADVWLRVRNVFSSVRAIRRFDPEIVYVRPTLHPVPFGVLTFAIVLLLRRPLVVHIMDHEEGMSVGVGGFVTRLYSAYLRWLVKKAQSAFTISPGMQAYYEERLGRSMPPVANAVAATDLPTAQTSRPGSAGAEIVLGYFGSLDAKMNRDSVQMIAAAIERLNEQGVAVRLRIFTRPLYVEYARRRIDNDYVSTSGYVPMESYREELSACDALVIAYNFDAESIAYCRFSMANKLADYLEAGKEVIVVGPLEIETVSLCQSFSIGQTITDSQNLDAELGGVVREIGRAEFEPQQAAANYAAALRTADGLAAWERAFHTRSTFR